MSEEKSQQDLTNEWLGKKTEIPPEKIFVHIAGIEVKDSDTLTDKDGKPVRQVIFEEEWLGTKMEGYFRRSMRASEHPNATVRKYGKTFEDASVQIGAPFGSFADMLGAVLCVELTDVVGEIEGEERSWRVPKVVQRYWDPQDPTYDINDPVGTRPVRAIKNAIEARNAVLNVKEAEDVVTTSANDDELIAKIVANSDLQSAAKLVATNVLTADGLVTSIKNQFAGVSDSVAKTAAEKLLSKE